MQLMRAKSLDTQIDKHHASCRKCRNLNFSYFKYKEIYRNQNKFGYDLLLLKGVKSAIDFVLAPYGRMTVYSKSIHNDIDTKEEGIYFAHLKESLGIVSIIIAEMTTIPIENIKSVPQ